LPNLQNLPFDVLLVVLRVAFVFLLYFFLFQVIRVTSRDISRTQPRAVVAADAMPEESAYGVLIVVQPGQAKLLPGQRLPLEPYTTLGRRLSNTIQLDDDFVSGEHTRISIREDGNWWVEDAGSTNGTYVNGMKISAPVQVRNGDTVGIGRVELRLEV